MHSNEAPAGRTRHLFEPPLWRQRCLNMATGPVEVSREVADAQSAPLFSPHLEAFWTVHDDTVARLARILKTRHLALPFHGSIRSGLDVAMANFIRPGSRVLAIENGYWGQLLGRWAATFGAEVTWVRGDPLAPIDPAAVRGALENGPAFDLVSVVHVETNTGVVNPVAALGRLVRQAGGLFFVDAACSAGAMPYETDAWHIDVGVTGSHKCLASVPGLAIVTLSDRAQAALQRQGPAGRSNYYDLLQWTEATVVRREPPPFTQPVSLLLALRASLQDLEERGETRHQTVHAAATAFMDGVRQAGLRMVLDAGAARHDRAAYSDTVQAVEYADGMDDARFRNLLLEDFGIYVIGNLGHLSGRSFRVGLMSPSQVEPTNLYGTLHAIGAVSRQFLDGSS